MTITVLPSTIDEINNYTAATLANRADCYCPDNADSAGSHFLRSVRNSVLNELNQHASITDALAYLDGDGAHEIADNAPGVYTHGRWLQFVDLGAYREDLDELGGTTGDMERDAGVALYMIAERLVHALVEEIRDGLDDDED